MKRIIFVWIMLPLLLLKPWGEDRAKANTSATQAFYVSPAGDDSQDCRTPAAACRTIRRALAVSAAEDAIYLGAGIYTEGELVIQDRKLIGAGAGSTFLDGGGANRVLRTAGLTTIARLTIRNGATAEDGGGLFVNGSLTMRQVEIVGNRAANGGGLRNGGVIDLQGVTFEGNQAALTGGGMSNPNGVARMVNVTFSGNQGAGAGGGLHNAFGVIELANATFFGNSASSGGAIFNVEGAAETSLLNALLVDNVGGACGGTLLSNGYNMVSDNSCRGVLTGARDQHNISAHGVEDLADNGGGTHTHALSAGSLAVNAGNCLGAPAYDQRGYPRLGGCDIGSYERSFPLYLLQLRALR